ncbi:hypothetical protein G8770_06555 [Aestuariicella hydrocarbonica]|uniref:Uncharacterized protein n=1 Tax=Pseudomaricurvus hydrocarbonicus TaxID=1470433 RepID=A0A9E5JR46_9GAMM|nr:hypothetical protein [Aestuariicella hydrocarbonica]NHO65202.1 hypothetical protein [Aestuariicella hydrocarbonica]
MSKEEKTEAKQALLGELESIKDLLSEDEWEDIPTLNDTVPIAVPVSPAVTPAPQVPDSMPSPSPPSGSEPPAIQAATTTGAGISTESTGAEQELFDEADIPVLNTKYDPAEALHSNQPTSEHTSPSPHTIGGFSSLETSDIDAAVDKLNLDLDIDSQDLLDHQPSTPEGSSTLADTVSEADNAPEAGANAEAGANVEFEESQEPVISSSEPEITPPATAAEALAPGVLPGQQSLFDKSRSDSTAPLEPQDEDQTTSRPQRKSESKARGENPFLPKHIRDRLHTNKALLDIIKESPLSPAAASRLSEYSPGGSKDGTQEQPVTETAVPRNDSNADSAPAVTEPANDRLSQMVDDIIAVYLPKIEAELREKLMAEFQSKNAIKD